MEIADSAFLRQLIQKCRHAFYVVALFSFFVNLLMLTVPIYMLQLYDRVLASYSYETLIYLTLIGLFALVIYVLLDMARARVLVQVSTWLDQQLSPAALHRLPDDILQGSMYGAQALRDVTTVRQFVSGAGVISLFDAPWLPFYLFVIFLLSPYLGILATIGAIILFCLALVNEKVTHSVLQEANEKAIKSNEYADTSLRNAEAIQAMGMISNLTGHWQEKNAPVMELQVIASNRAGAILAVSKFMRLALQILMLGLGAFLVIENKLTAGAMIAGSILLSRALAPIEQAISVWKQALSAWQSYKRLEAQFSRSLRSETEMILPAPQGKLDLENVMYRVPQVKNPILFNLAYSIKPGELVAVIGPSGAGKSTLARLMVGALKPTAGEIRLDGADVYTWERGDFGRYVGYLPQDLELFPGTISENIARLGEVDAEAVIEAAKLAGAHEMILHLPEGYETQVITKNYVLSGGQLQRLALARAFYGKPKLIVLDEPNSNLDSDGEQALIRGLLELKNRKTTQVVIAHRASLIKHVDTIIVINEGRIQFAGPRDQVIASLQEAAQKRAGQ